jgi:hypothetical protein
MLKSDVDTECDGAAIKADAGLNSDGDAGDDGLDVDVAVDVDAGVCADSVRVRAWVLRVKSMRSWRSSTDPGRQATAR